MFRENFIQTAESVSENHPDKIADWISDAIPDVFIANEPILKFGNRGFSIRSPDAYHR